MSKPSPERVKAVADAIAPYVKYATFGKEEIAEAAIAASDASIVVTDEMRSCARVEFDRVKYHENGNDREALDAALEATLKVLQ